MTASSNAAAARAVASGDFGDELGYEAALAPPGTGAALGLAVLLDGIADNPNAATRFVRVGRPEAVPEPTGHDKTTLNVFLPTDRAGALLEMLEQFAVRGVTNKIQPAARKLRFSGSGSSRGPSSTSAIPPSRSAAAIAVSKVSSGSPIAPKRSEYQLA